MFEVLILLIFPWAMAFAATSDLVTMTISNKVSAVLIVGFVAMAAWAGMDLNTFGLHVLAGAAMLGVGIVFFALNWVGGGDAKLFAATALWLGWTHLFEYVIAIGIYGGLLTLGLIMIRKQPMPAFVIRQNWFARLHDRESGIPYGIALAAAGLMIYPRSGWMTFYL